LFPFCSIKEVSVGRLTAEKYLIKSRVGMPKGASYRFWTFVLPNIVGSQDTTGLMTSQELESMAATVISPIVDGAYQSGCHTASVWDNKSKANIPR
jgi:aconitate hydratase 2/2-methylisocitrate dehydratase